MKTLTINEKINFKSNQPRLFKNIKINGLPALYENMIDIKYSGIDFNGKGVWESPLSKQDIVDYERLQKRYIFD